MKFKVLCAAIMATVTALAITMPTFAAEITNETVEQTRETVQIGGYDCWEEDGNYFAMIDGEVTLIIDFTDMDRLSKCVTVTKNEAPSASPAYIGDRFEEDLSDGHEYAGRMDITNGDCSTPIFYVSRTCPYNGFLFKTGYILPQTFSFTVWVDYADDLGYGMHNWYTNSYTVTFNLFNQNHRSFALLEGQYFGGLCKFVFHKEGSTGEKQFNYWVSPV